ncbi:hypothetical protein CAMGR0001_1758 [Campylobacter gracilis RM3268]|uniref:Uncharacterized protein n=1 Tax=Campylobacter gracilis RM3268 TaxID=553220 RepID=C8PK53_9BACT|nr:hypothetical protein CAMGR0001_1758 [Campylobacter gracilis RM3268]
MRPPYSICLNLRNFRISLKFTEFWNSAAYKNSEISPLIGILKFRRRLNFIVFGISKFFYAWNFKILSTKEFYYWWNFMRRSRNSNLTRT